MMRSPSTNSATSKSSSLESSIEKPGAKSSKARLSINYGPDRSQIEKVVVVKEGESADSGYELLTGIQLRANQSFRMNAIHSNSVARSVVSNFRRSPRVPSPRNFARARVYFTRPTIAIAKNRDYSQSDIDNALTSVS